MKKTITTIDSDENVTFRANKIKFDIQNYSKCGEIFISKDNEFVLNCIFCEANFKTLDICFSHLLEQHSFIFVNIKTKFHTKSKCPSKNKSELSDISIEINNKQKLLLKSEFNNTDKKNGNSLFSDNYPNSFRKEKEVCKDLSLKNNLKNHVDIKIENDNKETPKGYWQCDICKLILKRGQERKMHEKKHQGIKRLICETCGKSFTSKHGLLGHMRTHTGEKPFKCRFCPKAFFSNSLMKSHDKTHIGFKPFKCEYCDHYFKSKYNKQTHEKKHHINVNQLENSVVCKLCNKSFKCSDYLARHLKRHQEKLTNPASPKPFQCNFCPSTFISNFNRNAHERLYHKGEYNYKCSFCDKGFLKLNKKRQHEEMHTRVENPYKCDLCECAYARPEGLKKHTIKKHNKDSPYKCKMCQLGFESIILFTEHCKQHNVKENMYGCSHCEARFDSENRLSRHLHTMHNNEMQNNNNNEIQM